MTSWTAVGHCPKCGSPIYSEMVWHGIFPPPSRPSCSCIPQSAAVTTTTTVHLKTESDYEFFGSDVQGGLWIGWSCKGIGFGQVSIKPRNGVIKIKSEAMDRVFLKALLCKLVDDAVLDGEDNHASLG